MTATVSIETFALLNPALTGAVLASAAADHRARHGAGLPVSLVFLVVPLALHQPFRDVLPGNARPRLASWLRANPYVRADFPRVSEAYVPIARAGIRVGLQTSALTVAGDRLEGRLVAAPAALSSEAREALTKARLLGRWLGTAGEPSVTYRLFGVRP